MDAATKLDRIDINILVQLQKDGRMTNVSLAEAVGLSPSPCLQRVKRLESAGYISGYEAHVNLAKFASSVTVFTEVTLSDHTRADFVKFESSIRNIDEVLEDAGAGDVSVLGHMANKQQRDARRLCQRSKLRRDGAGLGDTAGNALHPRGMHRLHGVHNEQTGGEL